MKSAHFLYLAMLFSLISCGEDAGNTRRRPNPETIRPPMTTDKNGIPTHLHRDSGHKVMSTPEAISYLLDEENQTAAYRIIPQINQDDESSSRTVRDYYKGRAQKTCGQGPGISVAKRIEDCANANKESIWLAANLGTAGEADWKLVTRNGNGHEVWMDTRTNMLWADASEGHNWCEASGNTEEACKDFNRSLNSKVCKTGIAGLNTVVWRLPTRNDFLQADLDGIRNILPHNEEGFWTATLDSASVIRGKAWVYESAQGTLSSAPLGTSKPVRCIGVSL